MKQNEISNGLLRIERHKYIQDRLLEDGAVRVADLSKRLKVSTVTIRGDLEELERQGVAVKTHGGAIAARGTQFERSFREKEPLQQEEKKRIGAAAAKLVRTGETVVLDVGTTVMEIVKHLNAPRNVVCVTRGLNIALELEHQRSITVVVMGGTLRATQHSTVNPFATLILDRINADRLFLSCVGISAEKGVTNFDLGEAETKQQMIEASREVVVVADSSKVGNVGRTQVAPITAVHRLITNKEADPAEIQRIRNAGVAVDLV